jgi:RimJ/RimL family protein N-acetyltransferase
MWENIARRLKGSLVALEPLEPHHEQGLFEAAQDPRIWQFLPFDAGGTYYPAETREGFHTWMQSSLAGSEAGNEAAFATLDADSGEPVGSTRYLTLRPAHLGLEIGWAWLCPTSWRTGANVEAKLLMLEHAFERLGCVRVEFKTDARNERYRVALAALPAQFEGIFRKHMIVGGDRFRNSAYYSIVDDEWSTVRENLQRRLAPAPDLGVHAHAIPVFGAVPAGPVLAVVRMDLHRASWSREVDKVYVLVPRCDILQLDTCGAAELNGALDILAPLPY